MSDAPSLRMWKQGRHRWPDVAISVDDFGDFARRALERNGEAVEERAEDLYLACGCGLGIDPAITHFAAEYRATINKSLMRFGLNSADRDDLCQHILQHLVLSEEKRNARIAGYTGAGSLASYARTVATREALNWLERGKRNPESSIEQWAEHAIAEDRELSYLRDLYKHHFKRAFADAFLQLDRRKRSILRISLVDKLVIDKIGQIYGLHRSSVARILAQARGELSVKVRALLVESLDVEASVVSSILRLIRSDVSLGTSDCPHALSSDAPFENES